MDPLVRVIGRIDRTEAIAAALRAEGLDAVHSTSGPVHALLNETPPEGVDVVVGTSIWDPSLWRMAKLRKGARPMVVVGEPRHAAALEARTRDRHGPDACATWPGAGAELATAVRAATMRAREVRPRGAGDVAVLLRWIGISTTMGVPHVSTLGPWLDTATSVVKGLGIFILGIGILVGRTRSFHPRWTTALGAALALSGGVGVVLLAVP